jgi:hypothetical protein
MIHWIRDDYLEEFDTWIKTRNLDPIQKEQFIEYCKKNNYSINDKGIITVPIMIQKNNEYNRKLNEYVLHELMNNFDFNIRVDQLYFTVIFVNKYLNNNSIKRYISHQIMCSPYFDWYYHGSNFTHHDEIYNTVNLSKLDIKQLKNLYYICDYIL